MFTGSSDCVSKTGCGSGRGAVLDHEDFGAVDVILAGS